MDTGWLIAGGMALTGVVAAFWGYIKSAWQQLASRVIVTCDIKGPLANAVTYHCWHTWKTSPFGIRTYVGWREYVKSSERTLLIPAEVVGFSGKLFWKGWKPIKIMNLPHKDNSLIIGDQWFCGGLKLTFIRGTIKLDDLLSESVAEYNDQNNRLGFNRYKVSQVFGSDGEAISLQTELDSLRHSNSESTDARHHRLIGISSEDIGVRGESSNSLGNMALCPGGIAFVQESEKWASNKEWYKERGLTWRRGWLLHGEPGTGKTSLVRSMAEKLDFPVYIYQLATLKNNELLMAWRKMLSDSPCMALIEDIDTIFNKRDNIIGSSLTFDCLLNCIDGVEKSDGVLLVLTTNNLKNVDTALSDRPGRIDKTIKLSRLDKEGRQKLCKRILKDCPADVWQALINAGEDDTPAQFQERCVSEVMQKYWRNE